mmetsp:Transcript_49525/g.149253  ORF Transcript_49525/g.149253 Transcript_49525/m.149253 type:complete len:87 (-) Transcript_49525:8-268(-)
MMLMGSLLRALLIRVVDPDVITKDFTECPSFGDTSKIMPHFFVFYLGHTQSMISFEYWMRVIILLTLHFNTTYFYSLFNELIFCLT